MQVPNFLELMEATDSLEKTVKEAAQGRVKKFQEAQAHFMRFLTYTPAKRKYIVESAKEGLHMFAEAESVADFPFLFGTVLERMLYAKYKAAEPTWKQYIKTGTQNDFRPAWLLNVFGLQGTLPQVQQRQEYPNDANLADSKVVFLLNKYGREFGLGWESIINDDLGAFADIAERFATAAMRSEYKFATGLFCAATGPAAVLFGTALANPVLPSQTVNNKFSSGNQLTITNADGTTSNVTPTFNPDTLSAAASVMRRFKDSDGEPVEFDGFVLVVPPTLEVRMLQALNPANIIQSGGDSTAGAKGQIRSSSNTAANMNITGVVNPYLEILDTSGNAKKTWYLFGKLSNSGYAAKVNFLRGHESPELCMKNPNKIALGGATMSPLEGDYESDSIRWRIRHIYGGSAVDANFAAAFVGA
jgi:hypothetical protein